jgi:hypothetical protein
VHFPLLENLLWGFGTALKVLLCFLVFYRRLYRRLPLFTIYAALLPVEVAGVWWAYHVWGYRSLPAWYAYWSALGVVLFARGLVIAELCRTTLKVYAGLWSFAQKLLALSAAVLLVWAAIAAARNTHWIVGLVLTTERGLELAASVILVSLFAITIRYKVWIEPLERNILLGLALYSTFQMLNSTFMTQRMTPFFPWWESVRVGCFDAAMVVWLIPLLRPLPAPAPRPPLISEQTAGDLLRRLLNKMRELANELKQAGKTVRK